MADADKIKSITDRIAELDQVAAVEHDAGLPQERHHWNALRSHLRQAIQSIDRIVNPIIINRPVPIQITPAGNIETVPVVLNQEDKQLMREIEEKVRAIIKENPSQQTVIINLPIQKKYSPWKWLNYFRKNHD